MAITTIPWSDGSGDNIYVSASSQTGTQTVSVSSDANTGAARSQTVTFAAGAITRSLTVNQEAGEITPNHDCLTFKSSGTNTIAVTCTGTAAPVLYYSTNGTTWTLWDYSAISISAGHPVFVYGDNASGFSTSDANYAKFTLGGTDSVTCEGSIATLINGTNSLTTIPCNYCFYYLFYNESKLVSCPSLPSTDLKSHCYRSMFYGTSIVTPPTLPATTLKTYCYAYMFYNCKAMTSCPELKASTLQGRCYSNMFRGCTNITMAPDLPSLTLVTQCYHYMFYGCSKLTRIKAMFTTTPSSSYTNYWVSGVASSGTFTKNSAATWNVTGTAGVPNGWTVQTASS